MSWNLDAFRNKDIVFVGKGKGRSYEGFAAFMQLQGLANSISAVDKQDTEKPLEFLRNYPADKTVFVKNEAIPGHEMPVPYSTPLQIFFDLVVQTKAITVGITGTKGKSTTTALTAHILKTAGKKVILAGNIGVSPIESLDQTDAETIYVLELSSYQLSDLKVSPHISACINLYNDHTDWHGSLENYWEAKHNIMRFAHKEDLFVYNPDFSELQKWAQTSICRTKAINTSDPFDLSKAQLYGEHNRLNALVAREIARELGVDDDITQKAVESFTPLRHRMQFVATTKGRTYVDDAIGMTPESTLASLAAVTKKYGQVGCLLLGGQDRNYDFTELMQAVASYNIPVLVLFPNTVDKMRTALPPGYSPEIYESQEMSDAVEFAASHTPDNTVILLSTAAPSYLLWKDFEDKGDKFQEAVSKLTA